MAHTIPLRPHAPAERHTRSGAEELGRSGQRSGRGLPDPELALCRPAPLRHERGVALRGGHWRPGARSAGRASAASAASSPQGTGGGRRLRGLASAHGAWPNAWSTLRAALSEALRAGRGDRDGIASALIPLSGVELSLPARIGDYTDFYTSIHHATAVGRLFRPDNPLLPNYKWLPVAYHGRASSVRVSGQEVRRPLGQIPAAAGPTLSPSRRLDYELEL